MPRRRILLIASVLALAGRVNATHQQDNLRGLTAADLCPPTSYVYIDEEEDDEIAAQLDESLDKYSMLYSIPYGDPKTCTVYQTFVVDTFKSSGRYVYTVEFALELKKDARISLPEPSSTDEKASDRTLTVKEVQLWSDRGFGTIADAKSIPNMSLEQVRDYYEAFALAWKATHKK